MSGDSMLYAWSTVESALVSIDAEEPDRVRGCVCPACRLPVIARRGERLAWHFAHAPATDPSTASAPCGFGLASSLRLRAIDLLSCGGTLAVPAIEAIVERYVPGADSVTERHRYRDAHTLELPALDSPVDWAGYRFPLSCERDGYRLLIGFEHRRGLAFDPTRFSGSRRTCVLALEITVTTDALRRHEDVDVMLDARLRRRPEVHRWLYHPNQAASRQQARHRLWHRQHRSGVGPHDGFCGSCHWRWSTDAAMRPRCPRCGQSDPRMLALTPR